MTIIIKYKKELINIEVPTDTPEGEENAFIGTFEIVNIAYDNDFMYGIVYGNINNF